MSTTNSYELANVPDEVAAEIGRLYWLIDGGGAVERFAERVLTHVDWQRLPKGFRHSYDDNPFRCAGIWSALRGVSLPRAVAEVSRQLGFIDTPTLQWLLRGLGETDDDPEQLINKAVHQSALVLVPRLCTAYWRGEQIEIAWSQNAALWNFFETLSRRAKAGLPIDDEDFGQRTRGYTTKAKHRLASAPHFPKVLAGRIELVGRGTYRLNLPADQIRIFEYDLTETAREYIAKCG